MNTRIGAEAKNALWKRRIVKNPFANICVICKNRQTHKKPKTRRRIIVMNV